MSSLFAEIAQLGPFKNLNTAVLEILDSETKSEDRIIWLKIIKSKVLTKLKVILAQTQIFEIP